MRRVQSLQNAAARLITGARRRDHITPVLCQLHWLPVWRWVEFKLACLVHQALCSQMPTYLADDIHLVSEGNRRSLRSSSDIMCALETEVLALPVREFGTVCHVACKHLTSATNILKYYWRHICLTRPRRFVTFYISALEILLLTYLLTTVCSYVVRGTIGYHNNNRYLELQKFV